MMRARNRDSTALCSHLACCAYSHPHPKAHLKLTSGPGACSPADIGMLQHAACAHDVCGRDVACLGCLVALRKAKGMPSRDPHPGGAGLVHTALVHGAQPRMGQTATDSFPATKPNYANAQGWDGRVHKQ